MTTAASAASPRSVYLRDLGRAFGGALVFGLPLLMTMEMWQLGHYVHAGRLALFLLLSLPLLYGLCVFAGFRATVDVRQDVMDTLSALAVGFVVAGMLLVMFGVVTSEKSLGEIVRQVSLQAVTCGFGAVLARRQLGGADPDDPDDGHDAEPGSYGGELFLMTAGALFVAFNIAPTEEVLAIALKMSAAHHLALIVGSLILLHIMVYRVGFAGQEDHGRPLLAFAHYTVPGYAIALLVSLYVLWTFGRTDGQALGEIAATVIVMGFPAAIGAAAARLLV